jgi:TRAP-type C4-dicarboxylate transport system substrate-binding protein
MLFEFGAGRVTTYHYMLPLGSVPNFLAMNRKKFESLPPQAQAIIRKYSGRWLAEHSAANYEKLDQQIAQQLKADPRRTVTYPSATDLALAKRVYASVAEGWAASSQRNRELLNLVKAEIAALGPAN